MPDHGNSADSLATRQHARPTLVYVHFPYCLKKCPYCDFASYSAAREEVPHARYADAIVRELELRAGSLADRRLASIFFGGGTPSLWEPGELGRVVSAIRARFELAVPDLEITIECNPTSLDSDRVRAWLDAGVVRASVGVQSLNARRLAFLGRLHDVEGGLRAIETTLAAGMPRVSGDLIFGVEGGAPQSPEEAAREADALAATGVTHVSAYGLTIEPGTQFGELARRGRLPIASDDVLADSFAAVEATLEARGFRHYEISNYAIPGDESRHNLGYWRGLDYLGLGCGAVGMQTRPGGDCVRYRNHPAPERWMAAMESGQLCTIEQEALTTIERFRERIMTGLRLDEGIELERVGAELGIDPLGAGRSNMIEKLLARGRLERSGTRLRVPRSARAFADGTAAELF